MLYRDLVNFEPIESIIQLRDADKKEKAQNLVNTYVISDRMADQLVNIVIPQLQFLTPADNKGVLIVGNYGTGKSHLMSVISAIAEYPDLVDSLNNAAVREAAPAIAGRFKVVRTEVGSVTRSLRDLLLQELEVALSKWGVDFSFPSADQVTNNKDALINAVGAFQQHYPDHGILLVVDELLDYLRTRDERALILDLGFLRELGEVAALTAFRFLGGLQETLFDNPRFKFVASQLRRVRDRFEQVRIAREDIEYVVAHRLLNKTDVQLARITEHLRNFTPLYGRLAERLEQYARLFPIHPAYIETFERVYVAEKREVLKTFSQAMQSLLDQPVPGDRPGLISYDQYWGVLCDNPSMRSLPAVTDVINRSAVLEGRVRNAYTRPHLQQMALQIIRALSVQRLTTNNIRDRIGITAEELRDGLCLYTPMPGAAASADFLLDQVQVALREIMRTVSGQYISHNEDNGQYYLDVDKDIDFAAKISERGEFMEDADLNLYFFAALQQLLHLSETTYVTGYRIWPFELPWAASNVTRPGYFFCGAPDDRSTAQPPRDFYIYILPPYLDREWFNPELPDEVIFSITGLDEQFKELLTQYAGSGALALESSQYRTQYAEHADTHLRKLLRWMREHLVEHLKVIYQGVTQPVSTILGRTGNSESHTVEDLLKIVGANLLAPQFAEKYPHYPQFSRLSQPIGESAREASALDAIRFLSGRGRTRLGLAVLAGLELLDEQDNIRPYDSPYAEYYLGLLQRKEPGQVVNHGEVIEQVSGGLNPIFKGIHYSLEPEWVVVVLLALVYNGDIVLNLDGREALDAGNIERAGLHALADLTDFRFYKHPRSLPLNLWTAIFEGLGLAPGLIRDENSREQAIAQHLQPLVARELDQVARTTGRVNQGVQLWNISLLTDRFTAVVDEGTVTGMVRPPSVLLSTTDLTGHLRGYKRFLENLTHFNTVGKLRNLRMPLTEINDSLADRAAFLKIDGILDLVNELQPLTAYLAEAQANMPPEHPWSQRAAAVRQNLLDDVRRMWQGEGARSGLSLMRQLESLKREYVEAYTELHNRLRLSPQVDEVRQRLYRDPRLEALRDLTRIELLPHNELDGWTSTISQWVACPAFFEGVLADTPTCPHCQLRPSQTMPHDPDITTADIIAGFDRRLDQLLAGWRQALRDALSSDSAQGSLAAMAPGERSPIDVFLAQADDDACIPAGFVTAATEALRGIEAIALPAQDLLAALKEGGMPCTETALQQRFQDFLHTRMRGHDSRNTRLIIED